MITLAPTDLYPIPGTKAYFDSDVVICLNIVSKFQDNLSTIRRIIFRVRGRCFR